MTAAGYLIAGFLVGFPCGMLAVLVWAFKGVRDDRKGDA